MKPVSSFFAQFFVVVLLCIFASSAMATPLDDYVNAPDASYTWNKVGEIPGPGYTLHVLYMASQQWLTAVEVDRTLWEHWLVLAVPDTVAHTTGLLYIGSGTNNATPPGGMNSKVLQWALDTNSITAELRYVPNQGLEFFGDGVLRWEDDQIAYTWMQWMTSGDDRWPSRMPMTKSAVRAMDTIQAYAGVDLGLPVVDFVVTGASKRGWTTWTTAAVDPRVKAFMPMVIDLLNVIPSFQHHYAVYGGWAPAINDYVSHGVMDYFDRQEFSDLMDLVDPYSYRARYATKPKMIVNATGDQFFLPDSSQFYFDDLPGESLLRYVPNTEHGLNDEAVDNMSAFYDAILNDVPRPSFTWEHVREGKLRVIPATPPTQVLLWQATNPVERNFNEDVVGDSIWTSTPLTADASGDYIALVDPPPVGWTGYFVELTYDLGGPHPMKYTTDVKVIQQNYRNITIDGDFSDWADVGSYYDLPGDTHDTDHELVDDFPLPVDHPDVDLIEYKFAHDANNLYAYFKATGIIGNTLATADPTTGGRYYVIVTIDVDNDDTTGYPLHEGGYYPTTPGYDMNMEVEFYDGAFNTGHYLNHGCLDAAGLAAAQADQSLGVVDVLPGSYDWYSQWVWWDAGTAPVPTPPDTLITLPSGDEIVWVVDKGPVYQGIIEIALSADGHEAEMVAPFRGFMSDKNDPSKPIIELGKTIDISFSLEASGELAPGADWASDTANPIVGYYLSSGTPHNDDDGDGLENGEELDLGTDPNDPDTDGDGMPDGWEVTYTLDPLVDTGVDGADGDLDGDSITNLIEFNEGTNPNDPNSVPMRTGVWWASLLLIVALILLLAKALKSAA